MTAIVGAESGQRVLGTRRPIDHQGAKLRSGKNQPQHISLVGGNFLEIEEEGARGTIPGEYVPSTPHGHTRHRGGLIEHAPDQWTHSLRLGPGIDDWLAKRELEELNSLGGI